MTTEQHTLEIDEIPIAAAALEHAAARDVLEWGFRRYSPDVSLACSFGGPSGMVLLDMAVELGAAFEVFYLDTDLLFPRNVRARRADAAAVRRGAGGVSLAVDPLRAGERVRRRALGNHPGPLLLAAQGGTQCARLGGQESMGCRAPARSVPDSRANRQGRMGREVRAW